MQESSKITFNQANIWEKDQSFDIYMAITMRL